MEIRTIKLEFVYSRMIRYPDNAITELRYSRISK